MIQLKKYKYKESHGSKYYYLYDLYCVNCGHQGLWMIHKEHACSDKMFCFSCKHCFSSQNMDIVRMPLDNEVEQSIFFELLESEKFMYNEKKLNTPKKKKTSIGLGLLHKEEDQNLTF